MRTLRMRRAARRRMRMRRKMMRRRSRRKGPNEIIGAKISNQGPRKSLGIKKWHFSLNYKIKKRIDHGFNFDSFLFLYLCEKKLTKEENGTV